MSITTFLQSIVPNSDKKTLERKIENQRKCLTRETIPSAISLCDVMNFDYKFKDKDMITLNSFFVKSIDQKKIGYKWRGINMVMVVSHCLQRLEPNLGVMEEMLGKVFKTDSISTTMISYNKANVLQYIDGADFFIRYARCLLNYSSSVELANIQNVKEVKGVGPDDLKFLQAKRFDFLNLMPAMAMELTRTKDVIKAASDMLVTQASDESANIIVGTSKTDPFGFTSLPFPMSLIFRIRMGGVERDVEQYEASQVEAQAIEYRVLLLKEHIENGYGDAVTERSLEINESRLLKIKRDIEKMEEDYELN